MIEVNVKEFASELEEFLKEKEEMYSDYRDEFFSPLQEDADNEESEHHEYAKEEIENFNEKYLKVLDLIEKVREMLYQNV